MVIAGYIIFTVFHYMFRPTWPSSGVLDFLYIYFHMLKGFCFATFLVRCLFFFFAWSHSACFPFVGWVKYEVKEIGFWTLSIVLIFNRLNTRCFGNWICLPPQVKKMEKNPIPLGPLKRANLNHWTPPVKVKVTLQLTASQSSCQGSEPILGLVTRYYFLS
jgi:hypothetical protein